MNEGGINLTHRLFVNKRFDPFALENKSIVRPDPKTLPYVDGGLWANSPSLVATLAAHAILAVDFKKIRILSIGNGRTPQGAAATKFKNLRPISPSMIRSAFEMMFETQAGAADMFAKILVGDKHFLSVNDTLKEQIYLDDAELATERLPPFAEARSKKDLAAISKILDLTDDADLGSAISYVADDIMADND